MMVNHIRLEHHFRDYFESGGIESAYFDGVALFEERLLLEAGRNELRSLVGVLCVKIPGDRTTLEKQQAIVLLQRSVRRGYLEVVISDTDD